jgi:hypothetical protein
MLLAFVYQHWIFVWLPQAPNRYTILTPGYSPPPVELIRSADVIVACRNSMVFDF